MLRGLVNKETGDKLGSFLLENRVLLIIKDATLSPQQLIKVTEAMSDNQDLIASAVTIVSKKTEKALDVSPRREDRRRKFFKAAYTTVIRSTSCGD